MVFTEKEQNTVLAVFSSLVCKSDRELNTFLGSITIGEMKRLYWKLHYEPYCENHGIKYEDMTEEDFIDAWEEENRWEVESSRDDWDMDEDRYCDSIPY